MAFNLGGLGAFLGGDKGQGGLMPQLNAMAQQRDAILKQQQQKSAALQLMMALNSGKPQQAPGGMPLASQQTPIPQQMPSLTGGTPVSTPTNMQSASPPPVVGLPGSQPAGIPDMNTIMSVIANSPGSDADKWDAMTQVMPIYGEQLKAKIESEKEARQQKHDEWMEKSNMELRKIEQQNANTNARKVDNSSGGGNPTLDDDTIDMLADQMHDTGKLPQGLGYKMTADKKAILQRVREKYPNDKLSAQAIDYTGEMSESRTVGSSGGRIKLAANSLDQSIPLAREAMKGVDLSNFTDLNTFQNYARSHTGDPGISRLNTALQTVITDYAAMISRTGQSTDQTRQAARDLVNTSMAKGQMNAVFDQMSREKTAQMKAIAQTKKGATEAGADSPQGGEVVLWDDLKE